MAELVYPPVIGAARTLFKALDLKFDIAGRTTFRVVAGRFW